MRHQRLDGEVGGALAGGERPDADVHLAGAQREDPAVAGEHLPRLVAELEVGADPRVVAHPARDVRPAGDAVDGVAVPLPAQHLAQRRADAVGHHEVPAPDLEGPSSVLNTTPATRSPSRRTSTARAPSTAVAPALMAVVRRWSSSSVRATAEPHDGKRAARPGQQERLAEAVRPEPLVDRVRAQPVVQAEPLQLADRARGEPVAAGLVAREDRRVGQHDVRAAAGRPGGRGRPCGAGADDENVGVQGRAGHPLIVSGGIRLPYSSRGLAALPQTNRDQA